MSVKVTSQHIQMTVECEDCGNIYDVDDYDENSLDAAKNSCEANEQCPECEKELDLPTE